MNRLTAVNLPGSGGTVSFKYDSFGRRIYRASSVSTSIYAYDGDNPIEETDATGTVVARYQQTEDSLDEPLVMLRSGAASFYHVDGLGSITSLSNTSGSLVQAYSYDSFGKRVATSGSLTNPFQYAAREFDSDISLYYYRARFYSPADGAFISEDPANFSSDTVNFYDYVSNNPLGFSDPSGLKKIHGNWCGPNWTGGNKEPYIPSLDQDGHYAPPIDHVDIPCMHHDKCYSKCRDKHPCSPLGRSFCEKKCDFFLVGRLAGHPQNFANPIAIVIGIGITVNPALPGPNGGADPFHPEQPAAAKCCKAPPAAGAGAR